MNTELAIKEKEVEARSVQILETAQSLKISCNEHYVQAGELLLAIKAGRKELDSIHDESIEAAYAAHKKAIAAKKKQETPFIEAERILKNEIGRYQEQQERIRREEELKLQELAKKQQEEMALHEAVALENAGLHQEAEDALTHPVMPIVVMSNPVPKVEGISSRENWYATVTDIKALCRAVADGAVPALAIQPNQTFLNQQARSLKSLLKYPGVKVQSQKIIAGRNR